jgi:hypothetical protein
VILAIALFIFMGFGFTGRQLVVAPATEQHRQGWIAILVAFLTIPALFYIWVLYSAIYEFGGSRPNQQVLGRVLLAEQSAEQQSCTGIVSTPQGVWLVGRSSGYGYKDALNLATLLPGNLNEEPESGLILNPMLFGGFGSEPKVSLISRLGEDGVFHVLASVSGYACLFASADGANVFVLTDMDLPKPAKGEKRPYQERESKYSKEGELTKYYQTAVFRTDDQGKTWRLLLEDGFMAKAKNHAESLKPYFYGNREVWAWADVDEDYAQLFYSPDQGVTVEAIESSRDLFKDLRPQGDYTRIVKAHVVQLDAQQARAWVSDSSWIGSEWKVITREAELSRKEGRWELGEIRSTDGLFIHQLKENGSGRIFAELEHDGEPNVLAELADDGYSWTTRSLLPHPFTPFDGASGIRTNQAQNFFVSDDVIVAVIDSSYLPLGWGYAANANAVYFSNDGGDSWSKLAIPGYLGLLGFDARKKQVFWKKDHKYDRLTDPNIYSYDLSQ